MAEEKKNETTPTTVTQEAEKQKAPDKENLETLEHKLAEAEKRAKENWEKFLRAAAETENLRKRMAREIERAQKAALERFVREILAVADSLELGLQAATETTETDHLEKVKEGIELTLKQLLTIFHKFDIKQIDPLGEKFNPDYHEAMAMEEVEGVEPGTVVRVFQKGYTLGDRLVRPALVVVAKAPSGEEGGQEES